jgi:hypothetical protein
MLFMSIGLTAWLRAGQLIRKLKDQPEKQWAADLARMCQVSLIGFAAGGAFLSLAYFDMPYNVVAMITLAYTIALKPQAAAKTNLAPLPLRAAPGQSPSRGER